MALRKSLSPQGCPSVILRGQGRGYRRRQLRLAALAQGSNIARRNGADVADIAGQGGWDNSHSSGADGGAKHKVLRGYYLAVDSNEAVMKAAAGYKAHEAGTDAGGRANIKYDSVNGCFFGAVIQSLQNALETVRVTWDYPADFFPASPILACAECMRAQTTFLWYVRSYITHAAAISPEQDLVPAMLCCSLCLNGLLRVN